MPLSDAAMSIVDSSRGEFLFPGKNPGSAPDAQHAAHDAQEDGVDGAAVHGFRSSFRDRGPRLEATRANCSKWHWRTLSEAKSNGVSSWRHAGKRRAHGGLGRFCNSGRKAA